MNFLKKVMVKKAAKKGTKMAIEREIKLVTTALVTMAVHKGIQKLARTYPKLSFLKIGRKA